VHEKTDRKIYPQEEHSNTKKISNAYKQGTINSDIEELISWLMFLIWWLVTI